MTPTEPGTATGRIGLSALGVVLGVAWWWFDVAAAIPLHLSVLDLVLFALAAAVMELLPIRLPDGRAVPTSLAVIGAAAILGAAPPVVALIAAAGWAIARLIDRGKPTVGELVLRMVGGWALAGVVGLGVWMGPGSWDGAAEGQIAASVDVGAAIAVAVTVVVGVPALEVVARTRRAWRHLLLRTGEAIRANAPIGASVASTAVLGALVHPVLGSWTLPTMLIPLFAARVGLDRLALGQRAYEQTIRAMSRLPEQLGTVSADHGVRVGSLARDVALELGLDAGTVATVVRAAHLHELGRIRLEPDAEGGQQQLAAAGAEVLHEVGDLDEVASIVAHHGNPAMVGGDDRQAGIPARIVAACCTLDRYAPDPGAAEQRHEVVVRLVREIGDLDVVRALDRVVDRRAAQPV